MADVRAEHRAQGHTAPCIERSDHQRIVGFATEEESFAEPLDEIFRAEDLSRGKLVEIGLVVGERIERGEGTSHRGRSDELVETVAKHRPAVAREKRP
ncbi:MAG: hypothetical protein E6G39_00225 [Actinobacteria bacterium]|nr:MAG: hypothetical protein E6G39_00225 [Actinomycetota bacterium]